MLNMNQQYIDMIDNKFRELLKEPSIVGVNVNDDSLLQVHAEILKNKVLLRSAFETFYNDMILQRNKLMVISV